MKHVFRWCLGETPKQKSGNVNTLVDKVPYNQLQDHNAHWEFLIYSRALIKQPKVSSLHQH